MGKPVESCPWINVSLEDCVEILDSVRIPVNAKEREERIAGKSSSQLFPYYGATGEVGKIDGFLFDEELVALGEDGVPFLDQSKPKAYMLKGKAWVNNHAHVLKAKDGISSNRYLLHFLNQFEYQGFVNGGTRLKLTQANMKKIPVVLPGYLEQKQIATKLDELLAQVDSIKARLDAIPAILKRFRQSVLAAAVSGRLTEDWRRTMSLSGWEQVILLDVVQAKPRNGYSPKAVDYETPYRNLTLSATTQGKFIDGMFKFVDIEVDEDSYLWVKRGDLLIQRANTYEYVGVSARYTGESNRYVYPDLMMKCTPNERILGEFLHYCLLSQSTRKYFQVNATGTAGNMPKINQKVVSNTPISLPPLPEQIEVVGRVEQFFTLADRIEQHIIDAQNRASQLTQSILSKAFKGDLTADWRAQNPDLISGENSAEALLKRIQAQRAAQPKGTRKKHAGKNKGAAT